MKVDLTLVNKEQIVSKLNDIKNACCDVVKEIDLSRVNDAVSTLKDIDINLLGNFNIDNAQWMINDTGFQFTCDIVMNLKVML